MSDHPLNIIITGGGTGGHLFPGISVAQEFLRVNSKNKIVFAGTGKDFEKRLVSKAGFEYKVVKSEGIKGYGLLKKIKSLLMIPFGVIKASGFIFGFKPALVIGLGGYSSAPFVLSAFLLRKKIVLLEQNTIPGITTRMLSRFAKRIYVTFENTSLKVNRNKILCTGNPVRMEMEREEKKLSDTFTVFITGGSQGAHSINMAVKDSLKILDRSGIKLKLIHQTGEADEKELKEAYEKCSFKSDVNAFFFNMHELYKEADLIISRAGATTIAELTITGKASIYIPFPFAADNHQEHNAMSLVNKGAGLMIKNSELTGEVIAEKILYFADNRDELHKMEENAFKMGKPDAAKDIVKDCYRITGE